LSDFTNEQILADIRTEYPEIWKRITTDWREKNQSDAFWLTYAANYLFNTAGIRWALDPYSLFSRIGGGKQPDFVKDLRGIQLVILTHEHSDHLDLELISSLRDEPIQWVIPDFMIDKVLRSVPLKKEKIFKPEISKTLRIGNLSITPFPGYHIHEAGGVPSLGYMIEFSQKRWLFPGDVRNYDFSKLPDFGNVDGVVAHLWLGKGEALETRPSKLEAFCDFFSQFKTRQLVITHLREYGRSLDELWDLHHFHLVKSYLHDRTPELKISAGLMGERFDL